MPSWYVFTWLCQCHLELERARGPSCFYFGYFFLSKNFNHITKDSSIFHLKSSGSYRPNYFPTSTPSRHTSHHHNWPIVGGWFLAWRNTADLFSNTTTTMLVAYCFYKRSIFFKMGKPHTHFQTQPPQN
jgi:hypothetical protein